MKALFKINADELTFTRAIEVVTETEDAAKVTKETVFRSIPKLVQKVRYGKVCHLAPDCYFKNTTCNYCKLRGHLESVSGQRKLKRQ